MPLTAEQIAQLKELTALAAADGVALEGYVPVETLKGRLADKDRAREAALADESAKRAEIQRALEEREAKIREYEDQGKTAQQREAEAVVRERQRGDSLHKALEAEKERSAANERRARATYLQSEVTRIVAGSPRPSHAAAALLADHPGLSVETDDAGNYRLAFARDGLPVEKPIEALTEWWGKQDHLRPKGGAELPLGGARGRVEPSRKDPTEGMSDVKAIAYHLGRTGLGGPPQQ